MNEVRRIGPGWVDPGFGMHFVGSGGMLAQRLSDHLDNSSRGQFEGEDIGPRQHEYFNGLHRRHRSGVVGAFRLGLIFKVSDNTTRPNDSVHKLGRLQET